MLEAKFRMRALKRNKIWITKDLRKIKVKDLETEHLQNILNLFKRYGDQKRTIKTIEFFSLPEPNGDGAQMTYESELLNLEECTWFDMMDDQKAIMVLIAEAEKRGIKVDV